MCSIPNSEIVGCFLSSSNCCFLTHTQISQDTGRVFWYSYLLKNFPQFIVNYTGKGFNIINKALDVLLVCFFFVCLFVCFVCFYDPTDVGYLISDSSAFSNSSLNISNFMVHQQLKSGLENLSITLLACEMSTIVW